MNREAIIDQLSHDIVSYVMAGSFEKHQIAREIKPEDLDERFEDYRLLLNLHFILKDDVVEFVRKLPKRLRSISTETKTVSRTRRGTVDGHINWGATVKKRYSQNPSDSSLFVCDNRSEDYDTPENLVLKRLISIIYETIEQAEEYIKQQYSWAKDTWRGEEELIDELKRIVERNVHVRRIRSPENYEPTERMLIAAENSRKLIYQEAADLLRTHDSLVAGDRRELKALLNNTAITPDDDETLFELYVLFRFVSVLESVRSQQAQFKPIRAGRKEVAAFSGDPELVLYYDQAGTDRDLSFVTEEEISERSLSRSEKVQEVAHDISNQYFDKEFQNYTNRPDVIVLEIRDPDSQTYEYLITEVKNSTRTSTIRTGIKEALEYLAFLRVDEEFVFGGDESEEDYFGSGWNGLLVVQDLDRETAPLEEQSDSEIKILQASELEDGLERVLDRADLNVE
ncbi:hypothetical protein DU500_17115 (plasmid) [Haloplanus rubicundus]|jgi:hypothetical protein|uniref:DUF2357 domain-containing protein n=1 Tax=Haloplanus rubicundus TaxID=1547898 RepID=A0A345E7P0_9EURY|nr:hypothetical protein [Haloplanus rubicundus]AXG08212.1 hypothetical protein DU500_17115 [Haloplanus rubicundus]